MSSISAGLSDATALVSTGDTTGELVLKTNGGTTAVTIGTDQSVTFAAGVVTTSPTVLPAGTASAPALTTTGDLNTGIFFPAADTASITTGGSERVRVNANGRVGIGVTPASWESSSNTQALQIKNTSIFDYIGEASDFGANFYYDGGYKYIASFAATRYSQASGAHIWYNVASGTAGNAITWVERMRIHAAGGANVGGTGTDHFFQATSDYTDRSTICAQATSGSFADYNIFSNVNRNTTNNSYYHLRCRIQGVADKLLIADSGNVTNTNNSYGQISDIKTKQDIVDAASQWDDIKNVRVRKFRFKNDPTGPLQIGVVAQELETVSAGLIEEHPDYEEIEITDEDGNVKTERNALGTTTKAVKYSVLYMKAVKALQEAMERIETLEAKNDALEARITAIENGA